MDNQMISIIIPVYKVEAFLDECVQSVVAQTYKNIEIILVDDASPDSCPQKCDKWAEQDERIVVIHKERNEGLSAARNTGLECAKGTYIGFVDSDDMIRPCMYEHLLEAIERYDANLAICGFDKIINGDIVESKYARPSGIFSNLDIYNLSVEKNEVPYAPIHEALISAWPKLYRREIFDNKECLFAPGKVYEDSFAFHYIIETARSICWLNESLYLWRVRYGSISNNDFKAYMIDNYYAMRDRIYFLVKFYSCEPFFSSYVEREIRVGIGFYNKAIYLKIKQRKELSYLLGDIRRDIHNFSKYCTHKKYWFQWLLFYISPKVYYVLVLPFLIKSHHYDLMRTKR